MKPEVFDHISVLTSGLYACPFRFFRWRHNRDYFRFFLIWILIFQFYILNLDFIPIEDYVGLWFFFFFRFFNYFPFWCMNEILYWNFPIAVCRFLRLSAWRWFQANTKYWFLGPILYLMFECFPKFLFQLPYHPYYNWHLSLWKLNIFSLF